MGGESVMVTLVGRGKYVPSRRNRRVPADDAHATIDDREQNFESGGGEASCFSVILYELHHRPRGNNPKEEHHAEIQSIEDLEPAFHARKNFSREVAQGASRSQAHNLHPSRRARGGKSSC